MGRLVRVGDVEGRGWDDGGVNRVRGRLLSAYILVHQTGLANAAVAQDDHF